MDIYNDLNYHIANINLKKQLFIIDHTIPWRKPRAYIPVNMEELQVCEVVESECTLAHSWKEIKIHNQHQY